MQLYVLRELFFDIANKLIRYQDIHHVRNIWDIMCLDDIWDIMCLDDIWDIMCLDEIWYWVR